MNHELLKSLIVDIQATLRESMLAFERNGFHVVLLCDAKRHLIGLATEGDVRRALLSGHGLAKRLMPFANLKPVTGRTNMGREELLELISEKVHCLPVLDADGRVQDALFHDKRTVIPVAAPIVGERELRYVTDAVLSGWISSQGKFIDLFEKQFASFCGTKYAMTVSNGTVALHLALTALGIGPGDEVIVPALTFVATAAAVRHCHAKPVFVDVEQSTWNIDPEKIESSITQNTKAIIPVHLYGMPCRMDRIMDLAREYELWVIEDAAEAHGAEYQGKRVGSWGHMSCFSFFGNKILTTGEGGMVVTDHDEYNKRLRVLRDHGMNPRRRYWHEVVGYNYRMTNLQAAVGVAQLERWDDIIGSKNRIQKWYREHLQTNLLSTQRRSADMRPVCWLYTVLLECKKTALSRDDLLEKLKIEGVDCRPVFFPVPAMPPYFEEDWANRYPVANYLSEYGFSLPSSAELKSRELECVADNLVRLLSNCLTTKSVSDLA